MRRWRSASWGGHLALETLEALAWGEVGERHARRVLQHVRSCAWCRRRWEWVRRLPGTLEVATRLTPSGDPSPVLRRRARGDLVLLPVAAWVAGSGRSEGGPDRDPDR